MLIQVVAGFRMKSRELVLVVILCLSESRALWNRFALIFRIKFFTIVLIGV